MNSFLKFIKQNKIERVAIGFLLAASLKDLFDSLNHDLFFPLASELTDGKYPNLNMKKIMKEIFVFIITLIMIYYITKMLNIKKINIQH